MSYAILLAFAVIYVGPLLMLVSASFKTLPEFFKNPTGLPESIGLSNFTDAWELASFPRFLVNSLFYTAVATSVMIFTSGRFR